MGTLSEFLDSENAKSSHSGSRACIFAYFLQLVKSRNAMALEKLYRNETYSSKDIAQSSYHYAKKGFLKITDADSCKGVAATQAAPAARAEQNLKLSKRSGKAVM